MLDLVALLAAVSVESITLTIATTALTHSQPPKIAFVHFTTLQ
uniref:Uncharacterized protein n=1 Tax=Anguilla anguilla TaxID=7936 RepID=A0A0E9Q904_ANGAN